MKHIPFITTLITFFLSLSLSAQVDLVPGRFSFEPQLSYDEKIKSPSQFLEYKLGQKFTVYADAVQYFQYLASSSDRIKINHYGTTYEGRKLYNVVITSPENHKNIDVILEQNNRLADPRSLSSADAEKIINNKPVIISYSYNIHGNEASSTEAAMQVSYRYVAAKDRDTENILSKAVLVFYICINPDGRDRYVYWYNSTQRAYPAINPSELDHFAPWPNGRTNHYWFDLNRDWVWGIHPESRGHTAEYLKWMPQLHTDYHEQGYNSNYFTVPGTTPRNLLVPDDYEKLADTIGKANISAFDTHKISYFTREAFDFFYPGYGSSYPTVMNAIGMLTEQGGIAGGTAIKTDDDYVLTLRQRIFDHYTTSIATVRKAVEQKVLFNKYFYNSSDPKNSKSKTKSYILSNDGSIYLPEVINMLLHHKVEVHRTLTPSVVNNLQSFRTGLTENITIPEGSYIVHTNQPKHLFINSVLSQSMTIEDSVMYDMSVWSAPLAYNLEAYSSEKELNTPTERVQNKISISGKVIEPKANYAYVIDWHQRGAPKALSLLWEKGYRIRSAEEAFSSEKDNFSAGSLIVLLGRNMEKSDMWETDMVEVSKKAGVTIHGLNTGRMNTGNDLASRKSIVLKNPKAAMLVEPPFDTYTSGQIYFLFDQETHFPLDRIRASTLQQSSLPKLGSRYGYADLDDYNVLIMAGGGSNLSKVFAEKEQQILKSWIEAGGTLILTEDATEFFSKEKSKVANVEFVTSPKDSSQEAKYLSYSERTDYYGKKRIPGSAFHSSIDVSHPLGFGLKPELYSLSFGDKPLKPSNTLESVGIYHKDPDQLLVSGYASSDNLKTLAGHSWAGVARLGQGKIVYLVDNTQYRMFWRGPSRMMQNAVMLLPSY